MSIFERLLVGAMTRCVRRGDLVLLTPSGARRVIGDGGSPRAVVRLTDPSAARELLLDPDLRTGELFTEGRLVVEEGTIYDFLELVLRGARDAPVPLSVRILDRWRYAGRRFLQRNGLVRARRNVAHHYDLDGRLYDLFLDTDRQYSCAYFEHDDEDLDSAQLAKKRHIARKLRIGPADRVLDIGCGWGGLSLYLAGTAGAAAVLGVTLSREQLAAARTTAAARGLDERVRFALQDYREVDGSFDRIVSVGMFEHVGVGFYDTFFDTCHRLLAKDGVMLLHYIGNSDTPDFTNPWIERYIFPGGHIPSLSEVLPAIERSGLVVTDVEVLRLHYAKTLSAWRNRFLARRQEAARLYDERFCRMWEFYLAMSEAAFRYQDIAVFQIQLTRPG